MIAARVYAPSPSPASRAGLLFLILGAHALVALTMLSIGGVAVIVERAPLLVSFMPDPPARPPPLPAAAVPLPQMHKPQVRVPEPPRFEVLQTVEAVERPASPRPQPPQPSIQPERRAGPEASASIEPPRYDLAYLDNPPPAYPVFAKRAREQGVVMLRVRVDAEGMVQGAEIHRSSGFERLDAAALAAVKRWRFAPARQGGRAVAGVAIVPINFQLDT